ncbi:MAG: cell division protein FtsZ [Bacteroidetes bacterium]|nr:cell division protein FtsZ [Bacteroidota bacterium]
MEFDIPQEEKAVIKVIGVGGGGSNAVTHMYRQGIVGVEYAITNTDRQALESSPVPTKIPLGPELTDGRGAGSKPEIGRQACIESVDKVKDFLQDTKMVFVTAGMGGGTGTGAAPVIAKAAQETGVLTVGIVTLPFSFEGRRRAKQALAGLEELRKYVDSLLVISNDKLREMHGNLVLDEAFGQADNILTSAAKGIAEIITIEGKINVDFEDVNTVMRDSGVAIMGTAIMEGEDRANRAIEAALNSPLLEENNINGADHILLNITSGSQQITMDEIVEITDYLQDEAGYGTDLIWGHCYDDSLGDKISVTLIATGFEQSTLPDEKKNRRGNSVRIPLEDKWEQDDQVQESAVSHPESTPSDNVIEFDDIEDAYADLHRNNERKEPFIKDEIRRKNEERKREQLQSDAQRRESLRLRTKNLSRKAIVDMENTPAYRRRKVELDNDVDQDDAQLSNYSVGEGEEPLDRGNSYLHDNVD